MKTAVIKIEDIDSVLAPAGVEKHMCTLPGIHKVETNFMTGTATVVHDESVSIEEIKRCVAECGYTCTGECLPEHLTRPGDPPAAITGTIEHSAHAGRVMPAAKDDTARQAQELSEHAGHVDASRQALTPC
jgi:P-type Cu2+ transporter